MPRKTLLALLAGATVVLAWRARRAVRDAARARPSAAWRALEAAVRSGELTEFDVDGAHWGIVDGRLPPGVIAVGDRAAWWTSPLQGR